VKLLDLKNTSSHNSMPSRPFALGLRAIFICLFALSLSLQAASGPKIFIVTDLEGVGGVNLEKSNYCLDNGVLKNHVAC